MELINIDCPISDCITDLLLNIVDFTESQIEVVPNLKESLLATHYKNCEQILIIQNNKIGIVLPGDKASLSSAHHEIAETCHKLSKYDTPKKLEYNTMSIAHFYLSTQ